MNKAIRDELTNHYFTVSRELFRYKSYAKREGALNDDATDAYRKLRIALETFDDATIKANKENG